MKLSLISVAVLVASAMATPEPQPLPTPAATKPATVGTLAPTTVLPDLIEEETPAPTTTTVAPTTTTTTVAPTTTTTTVAPTTTVTPEPSTTEAPLPTPAATKPATSGTPEPTYSIRDNEEDTPEPTTSSPDNIVEVTTAAPTTTTVALTTTTTTTVAPTTTVTPEPSTTEAPLPTPAATKPSVSGTPEPTYSIRDNEEDTPEPTTSSPDNVVEVTTTAPSTSTSTTTTTAIPVVVVPVPTPAVTKPSQAGGTPAPTIGALPDLEEEEPVITNSTTSSSQVDGSLNSDPECTASDLAAADAASFSSPSANKCAVDMEVSSASFKNPQVKPTLSQVLKFNASDNCRAFYADKTQAYEAQHCRQEKQLALVAGRNVSFDMAVTALIVESYPKVGTNCSKWALSAGLALKTSFYSCLAGTGLYSSIFKLTKLPSTKQLKAIQVNKRCRDLFADIQSIIKKQPHCTINGNGTDIHAYELIQFDPTLDWLLVAANVRDEQASHGAVNLNAVQEEQVNGTVGLMLAGVIMMAMVAVVVVKRRHQRQLPSEERKRLLHV